MSCFNCGGRGWVVTCIDDMCHGMDECIHGDGEDPCPVCCGEGGSDECDDPPPPPPHEAAAHKEK